MILTLSEHLKLSWIWRLGWGIETNNIRPFALSNQIDCWCFKPVLLASLEVIKCICLRCRGYLRFELSQRSIISSKGILGDWGSSIKSWVSNFYLNLVYWWKYNCRSGKLLRYRWSDQIKIGWLWLINVVNCCNRQIISSTDRQASVSVVVKSWLAWRI